jgi:hypothetical protein
VLIGSLHQPAATPGTLGCGNVIDVAGSRVGRVALAFCHRILWFDVGGGAREFGGSIPYGAGTLDRSGFYGAGKIELSTDGEVLAVSDGRDVRLFRLPSGENFKTLTYPAPPEGGAYTASVVLSDSGDVVGQYKCLSPAGCQRLATSQDGATTYFSTDAWGSNYSVNQLESFAISPDDGHFAIAVGGGYPMTTSQIYQGNALIGAADGGLVDWLANDRLLEIVDTSGAVLDSLALPGLSQITRVASGQIYGRDTNAIYSTEDASVLWSSTNRAVWLKGDVAGDRVVFVSGDAIGSSVTGHLVRSEAH